MNYDETDIALPRQLEPLLVIQLLDTYQMPSACETLQWALQT